MPYRERRPAPGRRWLRPALVGAACLAVVVAVGAAIVTAGSETGSQPAATTLAPTATETPTPTTTGTSTLPAATAGAAWFLQDGKLTRVGTPVAGPAAVQPALELLLGGVRSALMATGTSGGGFTDHGRRPARSSSRSTSPTASPPCGCRERRRPAPRSSRSSATVTDTGAVGAAR